MSTFSSQQRVNVVENFDDILPPSLQFYAKLFDLGHNILGKNEGDKEFKLEHCCAVGLSREDSFLIPFSCCCHLFHAGYHSHI